MFNIISYWIALEAEFTKLRNRNVFKPMLFVLFFKYFLSAYFPWHRIQSIRLKIRVHISFCLLGIFSLVEKNEVIMLKVM